MSKYETLHNAARLDGAQMKALRPKEIVYPPTLLLVLAALTLVGAVLIVAVRTTVDAAPSGSRATFRPADPKKPALFDRVRKNVGDRTGLGY